MTKLRQLLRRGLVPILAVVTALLFGAVVIVITDLEHLSQITSDPLGAIGGALGGVLSGYGAMITGAFGDPGRILTAFETGDAGDIASAIRPLTDTLVETTPLIFTGLAVAISFRAGMFNIGVQGQLMIGALGGTLAAFVLQGQVPGFVILLAALVVGTLFGAAWGFVPGFLKARTGAHEVITTIMLNYVAQQVLYFALSSDYLRASGSTAPVSKDMSGFVDVPLIINLPAIRLDYSFIVSLVMAAVVSWLLFRTTKGYELRASGFNMTAARYAGMSAGGSMMLAMALSGGLAGLAGTFMVIGTVGQLSLDLAGNIGFNAIALALLAGLRPSGVVVAALLFGVLSNGGKLMGIQTGIPYDLLLFIMALVIMFVAAPGLIRSIWRIKVGKPAPELNLTVQPTASE
jgi:general nucleoside transport system permease protein